MVDGSFSCRAARVNPTLTIVANALRVGDHLLERLGATDTAAMLRHGATIKNPVMPEMAMV